MSKFKRHLKAGLLFVAAAAFALNCARSSKTKFAQNMENDAGKAAPTYEEWVALVGQAKTDQLYAGIGQDSLNLLAYGIGQSNMVQLINGIAEGSKLVLLVGNDGIAGNGPGAATGLGAVVTLYLLKQVDAEMQTTISANLPTASGGNATSQAAGDGDTIVNLTTILNGLTSTELQQKLIELFGPSGFDLSRSLAVATGLSAANQQLLVRRMSRVVAHVDGTSSAGTKILTLMQSLAAADITGASGKLAAMMRYNLGSGMALADKLVETIQSTSSVANLVTVIQGVTYANTTAKMMPIIDTVTDCTKMGYTINNVTALTTLINLINNVQVPANMGNLINLSENGGTWTGQVSPAETWGTGPGGQASKGAPFSTVPTAATITGNVAGGVLTSINVTVAGANYLPGISLTFPGCATQPTVHLAQLGGALTVGVSSASGPHYVVAGGAGCTNGAAQPATIVTAGTQTGMQRLVATINGLTPATDYFKLLNIVDGVSNMNKMVQLVQDVHTVSDVYDLVNNMSGVVGATCTVANGTDTVTVTGGGATTDATATAFIVGNQIAYVRVLTGGVGYTSQPTITVPGCTGVTFTAVGPVLTGAPITQITANNPMNNLTQVVELMTLANMSRLRQVMDGQRIFDNTNEAQQTNASLTTTYLGKLRVLMVNLSQPLEGPLKVGDLLNGVTNTDKIIDLIWGVSVTTNLATVINGIFKSTEVPGCSDGSASDADGTSATPASGAAYQYNLGVGNTTGADAGTCEASGNGAFWGERDRAVLTLVHLVENVTSSAKLVDMIDDIAPAKVIELVNHVSTYSQHNDGDTHVYPRGAAGDALNTAALSAGGRRLVKIVENTTTISQLVFVTNNVSSIIKMSKLVSFMDIGTVTTDGTGKLAVLINAVTGLNCYNSAIVPGRGDTTDANPDDSVGCNALGSTNAQGMGKMVNVIEFVSGATTSAAMVQLKNLLNGSSDPQYINKLADLINQTVNSSNIVGLLNGVTDPRYGTSTNDLVTLMDNMPRGEITKLVSLVGEIGNATGTPTATFPGQDHVLIAQLMAGYNAANITTTSGVGVANMSTLMGTLGISGSLGSVGITGGQNYTATGAVGGLNAGGGTGAAATTIVGAAGAVTRVTLTNEGVCTVAPTGATVNGGGTGATVTVVTAPTSASATNFKVKAVYINNGGSGYTASTLTFTGGTCGTAPAATTQINGISGVSVTAGGSGYTDSFTVATGNFPGGGTGAVGTALVAGPINALGSYYGGSGYTTAQVCPIRGAGGSGATCTVTAAAGVLTGCSAIGGGTGYIDDQIVSIGGAAVVRADVNAAGTITGFTIVHGGCGYGAPPVVTIPTGANECGAAVAPTLTIDASGVVNGVVGGSGTGCPANPTVVVGATPYAAHADGATAIIQNVTGGVGGGRVVAISLSPAADSLAQLLTNTEKAPGSAAINYNGTTTPNVSAREGMVRMLHHGVNHTSAGYLIANGGAFAVNNVNYPGIGSVHIGQNVLGAISGTSVMTVVNMLNNDTTSLTDLVTLIGCGDHVEFARTAPLTDNDFHAFCSGHSPSLW